MAGRLYHHSRTLLLFLRTSLHPGLVICVIRFETGRFQNSFILFLCTSNKTQNVKAVIITQPGAPDVLQVQQRPTPQPKSDEVLIKVMAAGVNRPDIAQRKGNYPPPAWAPQDIPGLEVAGIVEQCGAQVNRWKKGDEVCALISGGGYAEHALAHEGTCLPIPRGWSFAEASSLPETVFTVWHNVFQRGQLKRNNISWFMEEAVASELRLYNWQRPTERKCLHQPAAKKSARPA